MKARKFKCGMKVRIKGNAANHNIDIGEIVVLGRKNGMYFLVPEYGVNVMIQDIAPVALTKEEIEEEITRLQGEIATEKAKLSFMKKTKTKVFDENEFKVFTALQELKKSSSDIAKARAIAKLING